MTLPRGVVERQGAPDPRWCLQWRSPPRRLRQLGWIAGVLQQSLEDTLSGDAKNIADDVANLDVGVFQEFLDAIKLAVGG